MSLITEGKTNVKYIFIVIIIAVIVGGGILGYYYLWIKDLEAKVAELELRLPEKVVSPLPSTEEKFDLAKIENLIPFTDSKGIEKRVFLYNTFEENQKRVIYLTDENLTQGSAVEIIDVDFSDIGDSPFISLGPDKKYIVIELLGPGDTLDLVIADEDGGLVVKSLISRNPELIGYLVSFEKWESASTFLAKAISYGEGPPPLQILVDAKTGEIVKKETLPF